MPWEPCVGVRPENRQVHGKAKTARAECDPRGSRPRFPVACSADQCTCHQIRPAPEHIRDSAGLGRERGHVLPATDALNQMRDRVEQQGCLEKGSHQLSHLLPPLFSFSDRGSNPTCSMLESISSAAEYGFCSPSITCFTAAWSDPFPAH